MTGQLVRIASQLFNTPLLLRPETAVAIASGFATRMGADPMDGADDPAVIEASRFRGRPAPARPNSDGREERSMYRVEKGVALIGVHGELVNRGAWIGASSGLTSYEGLEAQLRAAAADAAVTGIVLDMNSPGGEATGCMEIGALVQSIAATKPVAAFVNGLAASAGYAIAAGATTIVTIPTGGLGSIGVVMLHLDRSAAFAKAGVKPTLIHAGAHKVDGHPLASLPAETRTRIQASIDGLYALFVAHVGELRALDPAAVRATEGGVLMGAKAVAAGLADRVGTFDDALAAASGSTFVARRSGPLSPAPEGLAAPFTISGAAYGDLGIMADRARCRAIVEHPEVQGRYDLALHIACGTDMTIAQAAALLAVSPRATTPPPTSRPRLAIIDPRIEPEACDPNPRRDVAQSWNAIVGQLNRGNGF